MHVQCMHDFSRVVSNRFCATVHLSFFISKQSIIKQLLNEAFVIFGTIKVQVSYQPSRRPRLITLTETLISISGFLALRKA